MITNFYFTYKILTSIRSLLKMKRIFTLLVKHCWSSQNILCTRRHQIILPATLSGKRPLLTRKLFTAM